jgi:hypothetical protein
VTDAEIFFRPGKLMREEISALAPERAGLKS